MSDFLSDTHTFIWLSENDSNLPRTYARFTLKTPCLLAFWHSPSRSCSARA